MKHGLFRVLLPLAVLSAGFCALFIAVWILTSGERELKRQMGLIRTQIGPATEFHWSESGKITVVVPGIAEETEQDTAIQWIKERKGEGLFDRFDRVEFLEPDTRRLLRKVSL